MGRPKTVYDWEAKRHEFFELYINQNKSLDEVISLFEDEGPLPRLVLVYVPALDRCCSYGVSIDIDCNYVNILILSIELIKVAH